MASVRRWYIVLVATIALQAVAWAVINLLQNLLGVWGGPSAEATAFQIAVIVIGLPVYLIHWLWAQRLAAGDREERAAVLRRVYLYGNMAAFLLPLSGSAFSLASGALGLLLDPSGGWRSGVPYGVGPGILGDLIPLLVLGLLWLYHRQVAVADARLEPLTANSALVRRLYVLGVSAGGLLTVAQGASAALRWVLLGLGSAAAAGGGVLADSLAGLIVGTIFWVVAWRLAQGLFYGPEIGERESALRKFYLHTTIVLSALAGVSGVALVLAGLLRRAFGLTTTGDIREIIPAVLVAGVIWGYHSLTLRADTALIAEAPRQAGVRRLSWYLVATVGLGAALVGLAGVLSALIRALGAPEFGEDLRGQLAWALASLAAGLPVWAIIWRQAQGLAEQEGERGDAERGSLVRRIYLYGFLFLATVTILGGLIYLVYRLLSTALGEPTGDLLTDLAQAIAFSLIAAGVLAYHGGILRGEGRRRQTAETRRAAELRVAVLDMGDGAFGQAVVARLRQELPGLALLPVGLSPAAAAAMGATPDPRGVAAQLAEAGLIVGPWQVAVPQMSGAEVASAVGASPARKLLLPAPAAGWDWAGVDPWSGEAAIGQVVHAVRQALSGEPVRAVRPMAPLAIVGLVIGAIVLLGLLLSVTLAVVSLF